MGFVDPFARWDDPWLPIAEATGPSVRVCAPSRLHFGLLVLPSGNQPVCWPDLDGNPNIPTRHFGGVGLMVQAPGVQITAQPSQKWAVIGPGAPRVFAVVEKFVRDLSCRAGAPVAGPCNLLIESSAREHCGLGTGTQLSLAAARAVLEAYRLPRMPAVALATLLDRGRRSGIGVHGFADGGFIVDGGRGQHDQLAPLIARQPWPSDWKVLLIVPAGQQGVHGEPELKAFTELQQVADVHQTEVLCRLVLLGLLPALVERDLVTFGEALFDFNRRAGELFLSLQGGIYALARTEALVQWLRSRDVRGVGQSSWGPTVFAVVEAGTVGWLTRALRERFGLEETEVLCTTGNNCGATTMRNEPEPEPGA
jgi:beta-RFAP synthase